MKINFSYKFRLYPNQEQEKFLSRQCGACRFVFNHFLRQRIDFYAANKDGYGKKGLNFFDTSRILTELKAQPEHSWLGESIAQALQQSLADLDRAYNNFFGRRAKFPRFKRKRDSRQSFRLPQRFCVEGNHISIPKTTPIRVVVHRPIQGTMRNATISRTATGKWFVSIMCETEVPDPISCVGKEIGIDLGLKSFLATSDGEKVEHPKHFLKAESRLVKLQRRMSRRKKGSNSREKAQKAVAIQHEKVANRRADFLHKLSRGLVDENQVIHAESLNVKGMMSNHRLAKHISDSGWSEFLYQLGYKCVWSRKQLVLADRFFPSSKRCHKCGWINQDLKLSDRKWRCLECGSAHDRDFNAAINILNFGKIGRESPELTPVEIPNGVDETGS